MEENLTPMDIDKHLLNLDYSYQRNPSPFRIAKIKKEGIDLIGMGRLIVGKRKDGTFWIVDGQHRYLAVKGNDQFKKLPCDVFKSNGPKHEAEKWRIYNLHRKTPTAYDQYKNGVAAGTPVYVEIKNILDKYGIHPNSHDSPGCISCRCVGVMKAIAEKCGYEILDDTMSMLSGIHPRGTNIEKFEVWGIAYILWKYTIPNRDIFRERVLKCTPQDLIKSAQYEIRDYGHGGEKVMARGCARVINGKYRSAKVFLKEENE